MCPAGFSPLFPSRTAVTVHQSHLQRPRGPGNPQEMQLAVSHLPAGVTEAIPASLSDPD